MSNNRFISYVFIPLLWLSSQVLTQELPQSVITEMSRRDTRYQLYLWHNIRDQWHQFSQETQDRIRELKWAPPRPTKTLDDNGKLVAITDNNSGEDFLYLCKDLIARVNSICAQNNESYGSVTGWDSIPAPEDADWPVAESYTIPDEDAITNTTNTRKSDDFYMQNIRPLEDQLNNPEQLKNITLGQLGSRLEMTFYQWLQTRFSSNCSHGFRPLTNKTLVNMDKYWDDPKYNWLGDVYSAHVNPLFWKILGWIDKVVEDWRVANNLTEIKWKGAWVGGPVANIADVLLAKRSATNLGRAPARKNLRANNEDNDTEESPAVADDPMSQLVKILAESGVPESSFADEVYIEGFWPPEEEKKYDWIESSFADEVIVEGFWPLPEDEVGGYNGADADNNADANDYGDADAYGNDNGDSDADVKPDSGRGCGKS